jgi:hypothetical protein
MSVDQSRLRQLSSLCSRIGASSLFSYLTILLLQIKVTWGMWHFRDLTWGDTSQYFIGAYNSHHSGSASITWSPLYTSFYGFLMNFSTDAVVVTGLHRWLIVIILAVMVLALMRRLLPYHVAWLMAAWWVVLPINFDALYEVHLFAVIPVMCAALIVFGKPDHWCRGGALAVLLAASLLMRNENLIATVVFAAFIGFAAFWSRRNASGRAGLSAGVLSAYAVPLVLVGLLTAYYYRHASDAGQIGALLHAKHTLNICQTYAVGYQQRYSDFTKSPWGDCQELMTRVYGTPLPTLMEALLRNPLAMLKHFLWNVTLIPNGVEVVLFNMCFGAVNPDYVPVKISWVALPLTIILLGILAVGLAELFRKRKHWWETWVKERSWGWLLLLAVAVTALVVMITQRPRPSYLFAFGIFLRAVAGMCLFAILERWNRRNSLVMMFPGIVFLMVVLMPRFYPGPYAQIPRLLARDYERLAGSEMILRRPGTVMVSPLSGRQLCDYLAKGWCQAAYYFDLPAQVAVGSTWRDVLERKGATLIYADESVLNDAASVGLVQDAAAAGWQTLAFHNDETARWILMGKPGSAPLTRALSGFIPTAHGGDIPVVGDWNGDGTAKIGIFRKGMWLLDSDRSHQFWDSKVISWGEVGDIPVVGDWNGDGRTKIGVFRGGTWFLDLDGSHRLTPPKIFTWGRPGDVPLVGDRNHNRKTKIGVYRSGTWLLDSAGTHEVGSGETFTPTLK